MFGSVGVGSLIRLLNILYIIPGENFAAQTSSHTPHVTRLFYSLAVCPHHDAAFVPGHGAFPALAAGQGEWQRKDSGPSFTRMPSASPTTVGRGAVPQRRETSCILGTRIPGWVWGQGADVCPASCVLPLENTWLYPVSSDIITLQESQWSTSSFLGAYQASQLWPAFRNRGEGSFYRHHKQEN